MDAVLETKTLSVCLRGTALPLVYAYSHIIRRGFSFEVCCLLSEPDAVADRLAKAAGPLLRNPHLADGVGLQQGSQGLGAEPSA